MRDIYKIIGLSILVLLFQCNNRPKRQIDHEFSLKINNITRVSDDTMKRLGYKAMFYSIDMSLLNNTDTSISFWMMNCSWNDNFIISINNWKKIRIIGPKSCTRNFSEIYTIEKDHKKDFKGLIVVGDSSILTQYIRLGFIYIKSNETSKLIEIWPYIPADSIQLKQRHNTHNKMIWSRYFKLNEKNGC